MVSQQKKVSTKKSSFYLQRRFYLPLAILVFFGWVGIIGIFIFLKVQYSPVVSSFDLSKLNQMEAASVVYDRNGRVVGSLFIENRSVVSYSDIAPLLSKAVVAEEDNRFYEHFGMDFWGIARAAITNYRLGKTVQGGSTVTQQLARNTFDLKGRTYRRKIIEMFLAMRIEKAFSKDQIMELYLNRVYFGAGFYGAEAAARGYFGKSAKDLNVSECALLAGLLKSPQGLSPWTNPEGAIKTRNYVLKRMYELGFISRKTLEENLKMPLGVKPRTNPTKVNYALDFVRQQAILTLGFNRVMNEGFHIYTSLDVRIQYTAELAVHDQLTSIEKMSQFPSEYQTYQQYSEENSAIEDRINRGDMSVKLPAPKYLQGAVLVVDNFSGGILAMVGGRNFYHSEYNRALQARREAGTAFTPLVYLTAYDRGVFPGEIVQDACMDNRYVMVGGAEGILGEWGVERSGNSYEGPVTTRYALALGKNAATVRLGLQIGLDTVQKLASRAGISSKLYDFPKTFLGSSEIRLAELALAYTTFPGLGSRPKDLHLIERITDAENRIVYQNYQKHLQVTSTEAAYQAHSILQDVIRIGTGANAAQALGSTAKFVAGKTGTSYNFFDAYFVGYTSSVTCAVWVGFDQRQKIFRGAFGNVLALPVGVAILNQSIQHGFPAQELSLPKDLKPIEICKVSGLLATPDCVQSVGQDVKKDDLRGTYTEYATPAEIPRILCDVHGLGIRTFVKQIQQSKWPRAQAAVDVSGVLPIEVKAPTLLGLVDVYHSVQPASQRINVSNIPVQRALLSDGVDSSIQTKEKKSLEVEPQVRHVEEVRPDCMLDIPAIAIPAPPPVTF